METMAICGSFSAAPIAMMKTELIILIVVAGAISFAVVVRKLRELFRFTATGPTIALLAVSIIAVELCGGCESTDSPKRAAASGAKFFIVKVNSTPFYRLGPAQLNGPDLTLGKDMLVTLVRAGMGWSKVKLPSDDQGYVANEALTIAPSAAIAAVNPPPIRRSRTIESEPDPSFSPPEPLPDIEPTPIPVSFE